jgi:hypothetical protein
VVLAALAVVVQARPSPTMYLPLTLQLVPRIPEVAVAREQPATWRQVQAMGLGTEHLVQQVAQALWLFDILVGTLPPVERKQQVQAQRLVTPCIRSQL